MAFSFVLMKGISYILFSEISTDYLAMEEGNFTPAEQRQISWALFPDSPSEPTYAEIK